MGIPSKKLASRILMSERAFSSVETLLAALLSLSVLMATATHVKISSGQTAYLRRTSSFQEISNTLNQALNGSDDWLATFNNSANSSAFQCLKTTGTCSQGNAFSAFDRNANLLFDSTQSTSGYTSDGRPCSDYPSKSCAFQGSLNWIPLCNSNCPSQIPILLNFTWSNSGSDVQNLKVLGFSIYKSVPNPGIIGATGNLVVNFWKGAGMIPFGQIYLGFKEGSSFSFDLVLNSPSPTPTHVDVCRIFGGTVKSSFINNHASIMMAPDESFKANSQCQTYTIPVNTTRYTINDTIYTDNNIVLNKNATNQTYSYAIRGSPDAQVGPNSQFDVQYEDKDNYLILESIVDSPTTWDITYRHNQSYCAYLQIYNTHKDLTFGSCFGGLPFCFTPSTTNKVVSIPKTCGLPPTVTSGAKMILKAGNAEGVNISNMVAWP